MDVELIRSLRDAREAVEKLSTARKERMEKLLQDDIYQDLLHQENEHKEALNLYEDTVRIRAIAEYERTNEKKGTGYTIKIFKEVSVPDEKAAFEWCLQNFTPSLKLDAKTFKKAAKNGTVPDELAAVSEIPKVYIDSDLSGIE